MLCAHWNPSRRSRFAPTGRQAKGVQGRDVAPSRARPPAGGADRAAQEFEVAAHLRLEFDGRHVFAVQKSLEGQARRIGTVEADVARNGRTDSEFFQPGPLDRRIAPAWVAEVVESPVDKRPQNGPVVEDFLPGRGVIAREPVPVRV